MSGTGESDDSWCSDHTSAGAVTTHTAGAVTTHTAGAVTTHTAGFVTTRTADAATIRRACRMQQQYVKCMSGASAKDVFISA